MTASYQSWASRIIPKAYVLVETDDESNKSCEFSYRSAEAAAKAALRYNRIKIADDPSPFVMRVYVGAGFFAETINKNSCAVSLHIEFSNHQIVKMPITKQEVPAKAVFCQNGVGGIRPKKI